ncbi:hypothetical protein [Salinithrix halophila]|uniref:MerR HTH family regulatory protein n=1 Tax=Salinithrix halophila TaxID=1485204 RepID=A0ABV8JD50_9BACL
MEWLRIRDVTEETGLSDATVRRYLRAHGRFIKSQREGSVLVIAEESISVLYKIRHYYEQGWSRERVERVLESTEPMELVVHDDVTGVDSTLGEQLGDLRKLLRAMVERQQALENEVLRLRQEIRERDQHLVQGVQEANQSLSRVEKRQQERQKGVLSRFFKRQ